MTVDELNEFMYNHGFCNTNNEEDVPKKYVADLVESAIKDGYNKAIDEFAEKLINQLEDLKEQYGNMAFAYNDTLKTYEYVGREQTVSFILQMTNEIAEQMKEGGNHEED